MIKDIKDKITANTPIDEAQKLYKEALDLQTTINVAMEIMNG